MSIYIDPGKIEEMAHEVRLFSRETEDMETRIYRMVSNLMAEVNAEYDESYVREVTRKIKQELNEIRQLAAETTGLLNNIAREAENAASEYRYNAKKQAEAIMQGMMMFSVIDFDKILEKGREFFSDLYNKLVGAINDVGEFFNGLFRSNKENTNNTYHEDIGNPEDIPGYEQEKIIIQTLEKIKMSIPEDGSIHFLKLTEKELEFIGYTIGLSKADLVDPNYVLMRIESWRVKHGLADPKEGSAAIDRAFIESIQKEIRIEIKENEKKKKEYEEYKEKVYNLSIEMQNRLQELQKKAETGTYWQEYHNSYGGVLYGQDVNYLYGSERDNPDVLRLRYEEFVSAQLKEAGFNFSGIEELLGSEITLEQYVNTMGPIWQLMQEYRTVDDDLRDISIAIAIISAFAAPISMASGGAKALAALDLTTGIADAGVSMLRGDTKGAALTLAIEILPEFAEGIFKPAKAMDPVDIEIPKKYGAVDGDINNVKHAVSSANQAQSVLDGINPKYFNPNSRFGGGFYVGGDADTLVAELSEHGMTAKYAISYNIDLSGQKVLDLTNPEIASKWDFTPKMTSTSACQEIGKLAREQNYNVIKFESYRGDGINYVIFNNFEEILEPRIVVPVD